MLDVLYVSSAGGHFNELKIIIEAINKRKNIEYLVCTEKNSQTQNDKIVDVYLRYGSRSKIFKYMYSSSINAWIAFRLIVNKRPRTIISTGAHSCVIFFLIGKIFGTKNIYVESFAKVNTPSLTYRLARRFIDVVYVQHEEMLDIYDSAKYEKGVY